VQETINGATLVSVDLIISVYCINLNKENTMSGLFNKHDKYERDSKKIGWNIRIRPYACAGAQFKDGAPIRTTPRGMDASEFINELQLDERRERMLETADIYNEDF
jgi:hypothetical protein